MITKSVLRGRPAESLEHTPGAAGVELVLRSTWWPSTTVSSGWLKRAPRRASANRGPAL